MFSVTIYSQIDYTVDVIAPNLPFPIITIPLCLLIALNLLMHYYYAVTVKPGFLGDPPHETGSGLLWAQRSDKGKRRALTRGVQWSSRGVKVTPAQYTKCWKCNKPRPEVSDCLAPGIPMIYVLPNREDAPLSDM